MDRAAMTAYLPPTIVGWDGPEDADTRPRVERAVASGVRRAIEAITQETPSYADRPRGNSDAWGPNPQRGMWVLPSFDDGGTPVAVPVLRSPGSAEPAPQGEPVAGTGAAASPEIAGHTERELR
jgi:hypothetical protein